MVRSKQKWILKSIRKLLTKVVITTVQLNLKVLMNLLVRDFHKYVKYAQDKGFIDAMINTNASALTAKRSQQLLT